MKRLISIVVIMVMLLCGCSRGEGQAEGTDALPEGSEESQVQYSDLAEKEGPMLLVDVGNAGENNYDEDFWAHTTYKIDYDKTLTVYVTYNLSGTSTESYELTEGEFMGLYDFAYYGYRDDLYDDAGGADGVIYRFSFCDDEEVHGFFTGYLSDDEESQDLNDVVAFLESFR